MARNFRQVAMGTLVLATLLSGAAQAQTAPFNMVWDNFSGGFQQGAVGSKWYHPAETTLGWIANDAHTVVLSNGMYVGASGINAATGLPAFTLTLPPENINGGLPGELDNLKWASYTTHMSTAGFPGFDAVPGQELACSARMIGQTFGTRFHPFGSKAQNENVDVRLASFGMLTYDPETFLVFDFLLTNRRIYAVYERAPWGRTATNNYAAFLYAIPVGNRTKDTAHDLKIAYDRSAGVVRWLVNGQEVYRVSQLGRRLTSSKNLLVDHGGTEQTVAMRQLNCGMGMVTLLAGSIGNQPGLVRLSNAYTFYQPSKGAPYLQSFVDEYSQHSSRLFGQGAEFRVGAYSVSSTSLTSTTPPPEYSEPEPVEQLPGDSTDGDVVMEPLP